MRTQKEAATKLALDSDRNVKLKIIANQMKKISKKKPIFTEEDWRIIEEMRTHFPEWKPGFSENL